MKIALWGYGKMGKTIHALLEESKHEIVGIIDVDTTDEQKNTILENADGIIEFTRPDAALQNVLEALDAQLAVVSGTTAWNQDLPKVQEKVEETDGKFMIGSNFSIGVNILFKITEQLAKLTQKFGGYSIKMDEIHHLQKLDSPSGTAVSLAEILMKNSEYDAWEEVHQETELDKTVYPNTIPIVAKREPEVPGTHGITLRSSVDTISLQHIAHNRKGFAKGAITALEWLFEQESGCYDVKEMFE